MGVLSDPSRRRSLQNRSVLIFWALSYFAVLVIMSVTFSVTYNRSLTMLETQVSALNEHALMSVQGDIDNTLREKDSVFRSVVFNSAFSGLLDEQMTGEQSQYALYQLWSELKTIMSPYNSLFSCYISFPHLNTVMSYDSSVYYENLYEGIMRGYGLSWEAFLSLMTDSFSNDYLMLDPGTGAGRSIICYAHSVQFDKTRGHTANVLFFFFADEIIAELRMPAGIAEDSSLVITNAAGDRLSFRHSVDIAPQTLAAIPGDGQMAVVVAGDEKLGVSMRPSLVSPLRYFVIAPYEAIFEQVAFIRRLSAVGIALGTALSLVFIGFSLKRSYSPIRRMLGSVRHISDAGAYRNEMERIERAIMWLQDENTEQTGRINEQTRLLDENALRARLLGQPGTHLSEAAQGLLGGYQLALIACEEASGLEGDTGNSRPLDELVVVRLLAESLHTGDFISVFHVENMLAVVMAQAENSAPGVPDTLRGIVQTLQQQYDITAYIALSEVRLDFENIAYVYALLKDHIAYNRSVGDSSLLLLEDARDAFSRRYNYPAQLEHRLLNLMQLGDEDRAMELLDELFTFNMEGNRITFEAMRGLAFAVLGTMIRAVGAEKGADALIRETDPYGRLAACTDAAALRRQIREQCGLFCDLAVQGKRLQGHDGGALVVGVNRFIAENMAEPGLSLSMIADHFGLSAPYLSTLYSSATGARLLDSINTARIVEVKRLLTAENLSIERIAGRTGFSGAKTLTRVFKKYEGITPGQYREIHQGNNQSV